MPTHTPYLELVDGVEFNLGGNVPQRLNVYDTPVPPDWTLHHTSIHLPTGDIESHIDRIQYTDELYTPDVAVLHPTPTDFEATLTHCLNAALPIAIENMDGQSQCGTDPAELQRYIDEYNVRFVLDIQHAYEHDPSMDYAQTLVEMAGDALCELHVSGHAPGQNHALLSDATNQDSLMTFIENTIASRPDLPLVIEGEYTSVRDVTREYELLDAVRSRL